MTKILEWLIPGGGHFSRMYCFEQLFQIQWLKVLEDSYKDVLKSQFCVRRSHRGTEFGLPILSDSSPNLEKVTAIKMCSLSCMAILSGTNQNPMGSPQNGAVND